MRKEQKKLVVGWIGILLLLAVFGTYEQQITDNWESLKWPSFLLILLIAALSKKSKKSQVSKGRENINDIVNNYPLIKLYMAIYCLGCAFYCIYAVSNNIKLELEFIPFLLAIFGIMLPAFIVQNYKTYKNAGK